MSEQDVEIVRRFNQSWARRDLGAALGCAHADMEFDWSESRAPFRGVYRGHEELKLFWSEMWDAWDQFDLQLEDVIEFGPGRLVTVTTVQARGKGSGIEIEERGAMLWTVRGGKVSGGKLFQSKEQTFAAAGPSELKSRAESS